MTDKMPTDVMSSRPAHEGVTSAVGSVSVALRILSLFTTRSQVGVTEAATELGISRSTAHRMLATLEHHAFVTQDQQTKTYKSGPKLIDVALSSLGGLGIGRLVMPFLRRIVDATGETAHLGLLNGRTAFFLESVESTLVLRAGSRVGTALPAECCSIGRALLSTRSMDTLRSLYPSDATLVRLTTSSPASVADLFERLDRARVRGWADNLGESERELHAIAVPVLRGESEPVLALSCTGPVSRMPVDRLPTVAPLLIEVAADLAAVLMTDPRKSRGDRKPGGSRAGAA